MKGIRSGLHWAQKSVFLSAFTGFASFFLFLGFGYLDTFHAFVTDNLSLRANVGYLDSEYDDFVYEGFDAATGATITNHTTGAGWRGPWSCPP